MYRLRFLLLFSAFVAFIGVQAQEFLWDVDFLGFFDNREYNAEGTRAQTLAGVRLSPEIGVGLLDNRHRLMAGGNWIQNFGTGTKETTVILTAYYRYVSSRFKMSVGSFPRTQLIEAQPGVQVYDSLLYYHPNFMGALFQYEVPKGYAEIYLDWRRMQTETDREAFLIAANLRYRPCLFYMGAHLSVNHLARPKNSPDSISVMDDIVVNPYVGIDLSRRLPLDSLSLHAGYLVSLERNRGEGDWHTPQGILAELYGRWKFLALRNTFYAGGNQMPLYPEYQALFNQGDPFYQSKVYNRTDIMGYLFNNAFVNCFISVNFHYARHTLSTQQQLVVRFNLDNQGWKRLKEKQADYRKLKSIFD